MRLKLFFIIIIIIIIIIIMSLSTCSSIIYWQKYSGQRDAHALSVRKNKKLNP